MIDMKNDPKPGKGKTMLDVVEDSPPEYPWGLQLHLDNESLKKLGIVELPALDAEFKLSALVCVTSVSAHESQASGEPQRTVGLQIEMMALTSAKEEPGERGQANRLYG